MNDPTAFSCFLIGGDTLLTQCGQQLLEGGHHISGIITRTPAVRRWAERQDIRVLDADGDYANELQSETFDYLFAITHLELIPEAAVLSPQRMAINFHDGPLPEYAGLNAPMWALLNGASTYGITWHRMVAGIDEGDVLLRREVSISDDDTALSLNTKCFAAALESFPMLLNHLQHGTVQPLPQDLTRRSYFGRASKPRAAAMIDWQRPASDIVRLVRALNTGTYDNSLASAKVEIGAHAYVVEGARTVDRSGVPGTVLEAAESLIVAAGTAAVALERLRMVDGRPAPIPEVLEREGMRPGHRLVMAPSEGFVAACADLAPNEHRWLDDLASAEAISLPYRNASAEPGRDDGRASVSIDVSRDVDRSTVDMAAAFVVLLARLLDVELVTVGAADGSRRAHESPAIASHGFLNFRAEMSESLASNVMRAAQAARRALGRGPWLRDVVARHAALRSNQLLREDAVLPAAIVLGEATSVDASTAELVLRLEDTGTCQLDFSTQSYSIEAATRLARHLSTLLENLAADPEQPLAEVALVEEQERQLLLEDWNLTERSYDAGLCIHDEFRRQAIATPDAVAVADAEGELTFAELDQRSTALASRLLASGVNAQDLVGVHVPRNVDLLVSVLAVLKAGAAYVPLDPYFPADRLELMIADSAMALVISHSSIVSSLPATDLRIVRVDEPGEPFTGIDLPECRPDHLAYVIYTSGSTGRPKGVMIEHRNVVNFFAAMDDRVPRNPDTREVWLAVTSLSFDISVLELLWTVSRGFKVVLYDESRARRGSSDPTSPSGKPLDLGLFMWGNDDAAGPDKYRLMMEGAKYFDANGFSAVWTPERHFHAFGGPYPNPAVTGAAIAVVTERVKIRAGSCVVPLHHPIRVAEEWAVVDNLSNGRVEIAAASGWNPTDFLLRPENHADNKNRMYEQLEQIRALWRGDKVAFPGPLGHDIEVGSLPRPVQPELPCWITTAGNPETWRQAGALGLNVLTHLLGQTVAEVAEKIRVYREARREAGYDPETGRVALMLHTFVGEDVDSVRELVRAPMKSYLASSMKLAMDYAWSFPAFKRPGGAAAKPEDIDLKSLSAEETDTILEFAFERYFESSGLFGNVDACVDMLSRCSAAGVDEIACLLDFGVDTQRVLDSLPLLTMVKDRHQQAFAEGTSERVREPYSLTAEVRRHGVTHMQCTPSSARMFLSHGESRAAVGEIDHLLLGGEALPPVLVEELLELRPQGSLTNMYGPTETTIWSLTYPLTGAQRVVPIGRPIGNTQVYVLDRYLKPVPVGVPGELYIAGDGVARGYLNRPELTAERFRPDPFREGRMYATGDLVRYRQDGLLDFIGRADFQVKLRGYRIELGEIEHRLESLEAVAEAAVLVRGDTDLERRLAAFLVPGKGSPDPVEIRDALRACLPEYMVPSEFIVVTEMPRTANGKLDRRALMDMEPEQPRRISQSETTPENQTEALIADLWKQVLKLDAVGVDENFFDLGGHSLLVVQLHGQLKEALDRPVSLTDLYQYPTIRSLATYLSDGGGNATVAKATSRGERRRSMRQRRAS